MLLITKFYMVLHNNRYVRDAMYGMLPMVVAMILAATLLLLTPDTFIDVYSWLILAAAFFAGYFFSRAGIQSRSCPSSH